MFARSLVSVVRSWFRTPHLHTFLSVAITLPRTASRSTTFVSFPAFQCLRCRDKCEWLQKELGFDAVVDYKEEKNLYKAISKAAPKGIDVFFDNVGGEQLDAGLANINVGARVVICGAISQYNSLKPVGPGEHTAASRCCGVMVITMITFTSGRSLRRVTALVCTLQLHWTSESLSC